MKNLVKVAAVAMCGLAALPAVAHRQGDMALRFGATIQSPNDKSSAVFLNGTGTFASRVEANSNTQGFIGLMYMFHDSFGVEAQISTPFRHKVTAVNYTVAKVGTVDVLSPEVNLQWYPFPCACVFQPYVGVGAHYSMFTRERLDAVWVAGVADGAMSMKNHFGWNAQAGLDIALNDCWSFGVSARYLDMRTKASVTQVASANVRTFDLRMNPMVYNVGLNYRF